MLPRKRRLTKTRDFLTIYKKGRRVMTPDLALFYLQTQRPQEPSKQNPSRFGFVISKKQVRKTTGRTRLKRALCAAIVDCNSQISPGFKIIIQAKSGAQSLSSQRLKQDLADLLGKAKLLL